MSVLAPDVKIVAIMLWIAPVSMAVIQEVVVVEARFNMTAAGVTEARFVEEIRLSNASDEEAVMSVACMDQQKFKAETMVVETVGEEVVMVTEAEVVGSTMSQTAEASGAVQREKREVAKIERLTWQTALLKAEAEEDVGESRIATVVEGEGTQGVQENEQARYEIRLCGFNFLKYLSSAHCVTTIQVFCKIMLFRNDDS
jgi:hypothetical protein